MSPPKRAFPALGIRENTRMTVTVREALFIIRFPSGMYGKYRRKAALPSFFMSGPASVSARFRVRFRVRFSGRPRWPAPQEKAPVAPSLFSGIAAGINS